MRKFKSDLLWFYFFPLSFIFSFPFRVETRSSGVKSEGWLSQHENAKLCSS